MVIAVSFVVFLAFVVVLVLIVKSGQGGISTPLTTPSPTLILTLRPTSIPTLVPIKCFTHMTLTPIVAYDLSNGYECGIIVSVFEYWAIIRTPYCGSWKDNQ